MERLCWNMRASGCAAAVAILVGCGGAKMLASGAGGAMATYARDRHEPSGTVNWAQTYHDGGHTGYNSKETTLTTGNVGSLQLLWAASVSGGVTGFALSSGAIYAQGEGGSQGANLVRLNAATGAVK